MWHEGPGALSTRLGFATASTLGVICAIGLIGLCGCSSVDRTSAGEVSSAPREAASPATPATPATPAGDRALAAIGQLVVAPEGSPDGYDRDLFGTWIDADRDGCDTRCEVLKRSRRLDLPGLPSGGWLSAYDGYSTPDPSELDIDHLVPLAEVWQSGGAAWDGARRRAFANDLSSGELLPVTAASNRSKGERDPAEWQPSNRDAWCTYVTDWAEVKVAWGLTADPAEVRALTNMTVAC